MTARQACHKFPTGNIRHAITRLPAASLSGLTATPATIPGPQR